MIYIVRRFTYWNNLILPTLAPTNFNKMFSSKNISFYVLTLNITLSIFSQVAFAQSEPVAPPKPEPKVEKISGLNARFIVALISDGNDGAWIGTEDEGVFHWQADGKISQFTTKNGLGDNNGYALAIDARGRLWVGHLNTGVSVFNGKDWKNYDVVDGPIGERIFDIEICPKDGDVWMATSAGLTRFRLSHDWEHYTREDGLLEDQASSLAFKKDGTLIVGTQCHGLAIFARDENGHYTHERNIVAPERFGQDNCSPVPLTPTGKGLSSNLINDIIVAQNSASQTIWIATSAGLVKADNDLKNLEYQRGKDYAAKVHGLYGGAPKNFKAAPEALMKRLLPEDYLTALVEDGVGQIYVGMRQNGFLISDPVSGRRWFGTQKVSGLTDNFVTKIAILEDGNFLVGTYGGGVVKSTKPLNMTIHQPKKTE
jgi:ligand-binding sensor domain-containing protein